MNRPHIQLFKTTISFCLWFWVRFRSNSAVLTEYFQAVAFRCCLGLQSSKGSTEQDVHQVTHAHGPQLRLAVAWELSWGWPEAYMWLLQYSVPLDFFHGGRGRLPQKECPKRTRWKHYGFSWLSLRSHAASPLHSIGYNWVTQLGPDSPGRDRDIVS